MANVSRNPKDAHIILNAIAKNLTAQTDLVANDTSSFVSVGQTLLTTLPKENILNEVVILSANTVVKSRKYADKLSIFTENDVNKYKAFVRAFSFYSRGSVESGWFNTDLYKNFADGFDNGRNPDSEGKAQSTASMWKQSQPMIATEYFYPMINTWQNCLTTYLDKLEYAFGSESEFLTFFEGITNELMNDMTTQKEAFNRGVLLNHIAMVATMKDTMKGSYINLVKRYNEDFGTSYTKAELVSTMLPSFAKWLMSELAIISEKMTTRTTLFHNPLTKVVDGEEYNILKFTPVANQRCILYGPLFERIRTMVLGDVFNAEYLKAPNCEYVSFWQNPAEPTAIKVKCSYLDVQSGEQKVANTVTEIDYLVGTIYDTEAIKSHFELSKVLSSPIEARKGYFNTWWTMAKSARTSSVENCVVLYMADED